MSNVTDFPEQEKPDLFLPPHTTQDVVMFGRIVPRLTGKKLPDGRVELVYDGRWSGVFSNEDDAYQAIYLIAEAQAVCSGYTHFEAEAPGRPFTSKVMKVDLE